MRATGDPWEPPKWSTPGPWGILRRGPQGFVGVLALYIHLQSIFRRKALKELAKLATPQNLQGRLRNWKNPRTVSQPSPCVQGSTLGRFRRKAPQEGSAGEPRGSPRSPCPRAPKGPPKTPKGPQSNAQEDPRPAKDTISNPKDPFSNNTPRQRARLQQQQQQQ